MKARNVVSKLKLDRTVQVNLNFGKFVMSFLHNLNERIASTVRCVSPCLHPFVSHLKPLNVFRLNLFLGVYFKADFRLGLYRLKTTRVHMKFMQNFYLFAHKCYVVRRICACNYMAVLKVCNFQMKKVKVKLFLCLTKHHAMKTYWGVEV
jgi:hypothetical protein